MRRALPAAIRAKDKQAVTALRSALATIDNAEAVAAPQPPLHAAPGSDAGTDEPLFGAGSGSGAGGEEPLIGDGSGSGTGGEEPLIGAGSGSGAGADEIPIGADSGSGAGADEIPIAGAVVGLGAGEVERRTLSGAEMEALVRREVDERQAAARTYMEAGQPSHAERLHAEAEVLSGYLNTRERQAEPPAPG